METLGEWERKSLINELIHGMEMTRQLQLHLCSSSSHETLQVLASMIVASYEKVLSMLNCRSSSAEATAVVSESPPSLAGSPQHSGDSDKEKEPRDPSKKRKEAIPRWTKQVLVSPGLGLERPLDDGYTWRKYGQKDILGAKYPRGYYKCMNRNNQGCLATKQVQRSDDDPNIYEITYCARHTCNQPPKLSQEQPIGLAIAEPCPRHIQPMSHPSGLVESSMESFSLPSMAPAGSSCAYRDGWTNVQKSDTDQLSEIFDHSGASSPRSRSGFAYDRIEFNQIHPGPFK